MTSVHWCAPRPFAKRLISPQRANLGGVVRGFEDGCARYEDIGSVFNRHLCRLWINPAVHFDIQCGIVFRLPLASTTHFFHLIGTKRLAAKTWVHRHDEKKIELGEIWLELGKRRGRIQGQTSPAAPAANLLQGFGNIVFRFRFNVDGDRVRSGVDKTGQVMIGMLDHEMDVERQSRELANSRDDSRSEGNVIDEMSVHDVAMNPIDSGFLNPTDFIGQSGKIGGQDGGRDQDPMHRMMDYWAEYITPLLQYSLFWFPRPEVVHTFPLTRGGSVPT